MGLYQRLRALFQPKIDADRGEIDTLAARKKKEDGPIAPLDIGMTPFIEMSDPESRDRLTKYGAYNKCEKDHPEIARAMDIYADYTVSGSAVEPRGQVFQVKTNDGTLRDELAEINKQIELPTKAWDIVRSMVKKGDQFTNMIYGDPELNRIVELPVEEMWRLEESDGRLKQPVSYIQYNSAVSEATPYHDWEIAHFRLGNSMRPGYGVSILASLVVLCNEIALEESALTLARLTKAHRRLIHNVNVGKSRGVAAQRLLDQAKDRYKKRRNVTSDGRVILTKEVLAEQEDLFVAVGEDDKNISGISQLPGDMSVDRIRDIEHKFERMFAGLRASKAWFGLTGPNIRSVVTEQTLSFMRAVRRIRKDFERGANHIYRYGLLSYGVSAEAVIDAEFTYLWPAMSHQDDEMLLRLMLLRIEVAGLMMFNGFMAPEDAMLRFLGLDPEEVKDLLPRAQKHQQAAIKLAQPNMTRRNGQRTTSASPKVTEADAFKLMGIRGQNEFNDQMSMLEMVDPNVSQQVLEIKHLVDEMRTSQHLAQETLEGVSRMLRIGNY